MTILTAAIIGGVIGLLVAFLINFSKEQRFNKVLKSIHEPALEYAALYHYASQKRFRNSFKYFDSYGVLYLVGKTVYYKTSEKGPPVSFDMNHCTVQEESNWRLVKWFSISTPAGEKHYFDSNKMGAFVNNSDETLKGLAAIKAKMAS